MVKGAMGRSGDFCAEKRVRKMRAGYESTAHGRRTAVSVHETAGPRGAPEAASGDQC